MKKKLLLAAGIAGMLLGNPFINAQEGLCMTPGSRGRAPFVIDRRPDFINLPDQGFSISIGSPYDIINDGNQYYVFQDGVWYRASDYRGPWIVVRENSLPPRIRSNRWDDIRRSRDNESRRRGNMNNQYQRGDDNRR